MQVEPLTSPEKYLNAYTRTQVREIAKKKGVSTDRLMALIHASGGPKSRHTTEARSPQLAGGGGG